MTLPPDLSAARVARAWLRGRSASLFPAEALHALELLTTELVTNAVRHGREPVELTVSVDSDGIPAVRVCVSDGEPSSPVLHHAEPGANGGRGIALVDALATHWGSQLHTPPAVGKIVWFELQFT
ncbi:MAG: ATP-binding protein [Janthinobacterium lividum]